MKVKLTNFEFSLTDRGDWLWKAIVPEKLKRKVSEVPQYKVIDKIESENKKEFDRALGNAAKDIVRYLV
jgi:hypothetical protein